jgi:glycerophosphoryl diester phosphodiesterase
VGTYVRPRLRDDTDVTRYREAVPALEAPARPMVVAHRGASFDVPEHTMAAYVAAIEAGADAVECDVRMTRDGHLVCVHDRTVNRTSDGRGAVSQLDLPDLKALDFASWRSTTAGGGGGDVEPERMTRDGRVLTLDDLLALVHDASRPVRILVETKHPTRYQGLVERELVDLLARYGWAGQPPALPTLRTPAEMGNRAIVMSFAPTALRRVKLLAPEIPTVLLFDRFLPGRREGLLPPGVPIAGPGVRVVRVDPDYVRRAHARGKRVYVWTVDDPADVSRVLASGADAIITNRPAQVIAQLGPSS